MTAIFVTLMYTLLPEDLHLEFILSSLQLVLCRVVAVKRLAIYHYGADYIFSGPTGSVQFRKKIYIGLVGPEIYLIFILASRLHYF